MHDWKSQTDGVATLVMINKQLTRKTLSTTNQFWDSSWLHFTLIILLGAFIFAGTNGKLGIEGDDIFIVSNQLTEMWPWWPYLEVMRTRGYMHAINRAIFTLMGNSIQTVHLFYIGIYIGSALLFYIFCRRLFSPIGAFLSTLFYLAYTSKYHVVASIAQGGYILVIIIFIFSCLIAVANWKNVWLKAILISLLNWPAVHMYEILVIAAPLYPLLTILYWYRQKQRLWRFELLATFLPLAMFGFHTYLLATKPTGDPIWIRDENSKLALSLPSHLVDVFIWGVDATIGPRHLDLVASNLLSFIKFLLPRPWVLLSTLFIILVFVGWSYVAVKNSKKTSPLLHPQPKNLDIIFIGALYLMLIAPMVSLTIVNGFVPSRLTYLGSVGLALIAGVIVDLKFYYPIFRWAIPSFIFIILVEAIAFHTIIWQFQTSASFDHNIREQIQALDIQPQYGDTVFLSLPKHEYMFDFWKQAPSRFEQGGAGAQVLLVLDFRLLVPIGEGMPYLGIPPHERLNYQHHLRSSSFTFPIDLLLEAEKTPDRFYPLFLDEDGQLSGIETISIIHEEKVWLKVMFPTFQHLPEKKLVDLQIPPISVDNFWIDTSRKVTMPYWNPNQSILIQGEKYLNTPPFTAQILQQGQVIASKPVMEDGLFEWIIPLTDWDEKLQVVELHNTEQARDGQRVIWRMTDIRLISHPD